ncbi:glycoside hydrolase family 5 protein [Enterovirga aerilata]|uniref:Cellulase family glycosylhydrolase n=1 Tax=Enterovirga aerilata TaxID=2730920 RepID=A0A849I596_9HYPH|nr:cellulase family glycosylhydrolase [Enterovirga sp. DB1703]NNM71270.1 cellulase family glycosylhydrolase [Enterovirga sp. DB1703]
MNLGINLSGARYGLLADFSSIDYFAARGFSTIRLPLDWELLQPKLNGPLEASLMTQVHAFVSYAEARGMDVIIDLHNYGSYAGHLIGTAQTPVKAFADFWGRMAAEFKNDANVSFGLMNEPQLASAGAWLPAVNAAVSAIRAAGATSQEILVSGTYWDGAHNWTQTDNASVLGTKGAIVDPSDNIVFEVHQYLDDTSGKHEWVVSETIGVERLTAITEWARETGSRLYLGEFGVANNPTALIALGNMLNFLAANSDVWVGAAYWAAGKGWQDYMYSVEPNHGILDMPQMAVLAQHTDTRTVAKTLPDGLVEVLTFVGDSSSASIRDVVAADGRLLSRTLFDPEARVTRSVEVRSDQTLKLSIHSVPGSAPDIVEIYTPTDEIVSRTTFNTDGSKLLQFFGENEWQTVRSETYTADGRLAEVFIKNPDGTLVVQHYANDIISSVETFDAGWNFISRSSYDAAGRLTRTQSVDDSGHNVVTEYGSAGTVPTTAYVYDTSWKLIGTRSYDAEGLLLLERTKLAGGGEQVDSYQGGRITQTELFDRAGALVSRTVRDSDGTRTVSSFENGVIETLEVVASSGQILARTCYDDSGLVSTVERTAEDGTRLLETYRSGTASLATSEAYAADGRLVSRTTYDVEGRVSEVLTESSDGTHTVAKYAAGATTPSTLDVFDASWAIVSRTHFDPDGDVTAIDRIDASGRHLVDSFEPGSRSPIRSEIYDASWNLVSRTTFDGEGRVVETLQEGTDGTHTVARFTAGAEHPSTVDVFSPDWSILSRAHYDQNGAFIAIDRIDPSGRHLVDSFEPGSASPIRSEVYDASWNLLSRITYDSDGRITTVQHDKADGGHLIARYDADGDLQYLDTFAPNWAMLARATFLDDGSLQAVDHIGADGSHRVDTFRGGSEQAYRSEFYDPQWRFIEGRGFADGGGPTSELAAEAWNFAESGGPGGSVVPAPAWTDDTLSASASSDHFPVSGWLLAG